MVIADKYDLPVPGPPETHSSGDFRSIQLWNFSSDRSHSPLFLSASSEYSLYKVRFLTWAGVIRFFSSTAFCSIARLSEVASAVCYCQSVHRRTYKTSLMVKRNR